MANELNKEEYEELKRCFQFICDRLKWVIRFRKVTIDGKLSIIPAKSAFPKSMANQYDEIAYGYGLSHYHYKAELKNVAPMRRNGGRFPLIDDIMAVPKYVGLLPTGDRGIIASCINVINNVNAVRKDFVNHLEHHNFLSSFSTVDSCSIGRDDGELAKFEILRRIKNIITDTSSTIFTNCTESEDERTLYLEYLENPIPTFDTFEELAIKMDLMPIKKVEKKFKVI